MTSEKFCLRWNDFQANLTTSYKELRDDKEFTDVTLACDGYQKIDAHKFILSSASQIFKAIFSGNKHAHPLIYLKGIKKEHLMAVVDFIYLGEVSINQEDLDSFLMVAEELEIKGLKPTQTDKVNLEQKIEMEEAKSEFPNNCNAVNTTDNLYDHKSESTVTNAVSLPEATYTSEAKVPVSFSDDNSELGKMINSMLTKIDGAWTCAKCGKTDKGNSSARVRRHIETHIEGMAHPCGFCGKILRSRNCLQVHMYRHLKNK